MSRRSAGSSPLWDGHAELPHLPGHGPSTGLPAARSGGTGPGDRNLHHSRAGTDDPRRDDPGRGHGSVLRPAPVDGADLIPMTPDYGTPLRSAQPAPSTWRVARWW